MFHPHPRIHCLAENSRVMTKSTRDPGGVERLSAEPPRRGARPKTTKPEPSRPQSDDGIAVKIGRMLVRLMSPAAPDLHDELEPEPKPRAARPPVVSRPKPRVPDKPREATKISPPGKAVLKPRSSRAVTPEADAPVAPATPKSAGRLAPMPPEARRTVPNDPGSDS